MNVSILSSSSSLSAETEYELVCQAWGSRPAAVISWWKGGTLALKEAVMTTSPDSNVTTSILKYRAEMSDSGKYLTCRAENKQIPQSAREDGIKLNIHYKPVVTLQMGSTLDPENIKEGDDVYFECHINANPEVQRVLWYHNGKPLEHRTNRGIIIQNQTLVLQKINRESAGFYTCRAVNMEGEGESQPVELQVMYKPYCRQHRKTVYGTALHEPASVTCEVEANPGPVTFRWTFNNTSEHLPIPASAVSSHNFTSVASYAPKSHLDYGTLLCWAFNDIGVQSVPCAFAIIAAMRPDPPKNCSIANRTTDMIEVECTAGFDGGLPQTFFMEVYDSSTSALHRNLSSSEPVFVLTSLRPGLAFLMVTYAANSKGRSASFKLETFTLKVAEKRTGPPTLFEFTPVLGVVIGVVLALILMALVIMVVMKMRRPSPGLNGGHGSNEELKGDLENKPLNVGVLGGGPRVKESASVGESEDNDPDIIPHKTDVMTYQDYESIDRKGPGRGGTNIENVPSVRTLPHTAAQQSSFYTPA
ncbi:hemicentin-1-like [Penaeus monodon]|uniref:hemicentin-1-like n=1 Tax=Penaeus monodon TaxID=6687 RepID=UPI0018A784EF|nr:hemicentin-1-like [Penaeus monodon]